MTNASAAAALPAAPIPAAIDPAFAIHQAAQRLLPHLERGQRVDAASLRAAMEAAFDGPTDELYSTENRSTADGLAGLPRDYSGVPRLGPPLPGDLGRPILDAQNRGQPVPAPGIATPNPSLSAEEQRRLQEIETARTSRLFSGTENRTAPAAGAGSVAVPRQRLISPALGSRPNRPRLRRRIVSSPSSTPPSIVERFRRIAWPRPLRPTSCRRELSSRPH